MATTDPETSASRQGVLVLGREIGPEASSAKYETERDHRLACTKAVVVPASEFIQLRVQHSLDQGSSDAILLTKERDRGAQPTITEVQEHAHDEGGLSFSIRLRSKWRLEICLPGWCGGILSGTFHLTRT